MKLLFILLFLTGCCKDIDNPSTSINVNCNCGIIISNTNNSILWTIVRQNNCSNKLDTTIWHFPLDEYAIGNELCDLINLDTIK